MRRDDIDDMELQGDDTEERTNEAGQTEAGASQNPGSAKTKETNEQTPSDTTATATASAAPPGTAADNTTDIVTNATSTTEQRRRRRRRPRDRVRGAAGRRLPTVKRTATATQTYRAPTSGDSAGGDGQLKKRKDMAADVEPKSRSVDEPQLDPTLERRRSFSRIPTGSRQQ